MNGYNSLFWLLLFALFGVGCEYPQQQAYSDIEGLTLADLQAESILVKESLLSFSVLTYVLDAESLDSLDEIIDSLSYGNIRYDNAAAFEATGFKVGLGMHDEGSQVAQRLQDIGAVRVSQSSLIIPTNSNEILFGTDLVGQRTIIYSTSATGIGGATVSSGKLGWVISATKDESDAVKGMLCPAFWQVGASDLRILTGKEPYQFHFFDVGRFTFEMEQGQFCLLGPQRLVKNQNTLDGLLFEVQGRGEKVRFFVIIFGGLRQVDDE